MMKVMYLVAAEIGRGSAALPGKVEMVRGHAESLPTAAASFWRRPHLSRSRAHRRLAKRKIGCEMKNVLWSRRAGKRPLMRGAA